MNMTVDFDGDRDERLPHFRIGQRQTPHMTTWWSADLTLDDARELRDLLTEAIDRGTR